MFVIPVLGVAGFCRPGTKQKHECHCFLGQPILHGPVKHSVSVHVV